MENMKYRLCTLLLLLSLCSCSNILSKNVKAESNTYVTIVPGDVSVRSVNPTEEYALEHLSSIYFYAKQTGISRRTLANGLSKLSDLYDRQFILEDGAGEYTFELQGVIDNIWFYDKLENVQIEESATNAITFELQPVSGSTNPNVPFEDFGGISITLNFNKTNVKKIQYTLQDFATWDDELLDGYGDWAIVEQGDITSLSSGTVKYEHLVKNTTGNTARLPVGTYRLTFDFMAEDGTDFVLINSFPYVVNVVKGRNSYLNETFDLNPVYSITYTDNGGSLAPGEKRPTKFTNVDRPVLPKMEKDGYTFKGWYSTSNFANETGPLTVIPENQADTLYLYAKFQSSALHVDYDNGDDSNPDPNDPKLQTIGAAIDAIKDSEDTNLDWQIFIHGDYPEPCEIPNDVYGYARSITLLGGTGTDSITVSGVSDPALKIDAATSEDNRVDVKIKDLEITGGVYVAEYSKLYVSGLTVIDNLVVEDTFETDQADAAIYLAGNLSDGSSITITPVNYEDDAPRLHYSSVIKTRYVYTISEEKIKIKDNNEYFHVTEETGSSKEWYIDDDGCLTFDCTVSFISNGNNSSVTVPCCSTILPDDADFQAPSNPGYVFVGWCFKKLISDSPETYDARLFIYEDEYNYDVTFIEEDMELIATWVCDTDTIYVDTANGINLIKYDDTENEIVFADGSQTSPFDSVDCALEAIRIINNSTRDYTIIVSGLTDEYNIQIDDTIPANSITLQGTPGDGGEGDGIYLNQVPMNPEIESVIVVSGNVNVTIKDMKFYFEPTDRADKDGIVLSVKNGAAVTLENVQFEAGGLQDSLVIGSAIAVSNDSSLVMNGDSLITNWKYPDGAVIVDNTSSFTMNAGSITDGRIGVNLKADGSNIANFIMNGGTISGNNVHGIFFDRMPDNGVTGKITLGGTAVIAADNDIYLPDFMTIEIASELTNVVNASTKPAITPVNYTRTTALVALAQEAASSLAETEFPKFTVTPYHSQNWKINIDGTLLQTGLIAKTKPNAVGDIVLKDGTVYGNALNTDASDIPDEVKNNAVAVIFYAGTASDTLGARVIGLGLYNSDETNSNGFVWADSSAYGYDNKLTDLLHDPSNNIYDNDGRDNWTKLCTADSTGTSPANAATKYPAFNWVNNYATNFSVGDKYTDNWFMPSAGEMSILWGSSQETMDQVLQKLGSTIMDWYSYKWYWTSSQSSSASQAYSRQGNNSTAKAKYYPYAVLACYDFTE